MSDDEVHLLVMSGIAPRTFDDRKTEFGIQDKKQVLHPGKSSRGVINFVISARVKDADSKARFSGPFIHAGSGGRQHIYLGWRYLDDTKWINRMKVQLEMPWAIAAEALSDMQTLSIDATEPEWGVQGKWRPSFVGEWRLRNV